MRSNVRVIKVDNDHRIYLYPKKVQYRERRYGKLTIKFSGLSLLDLLESQVINNDVKKRIREIIEKSF